MGSPGDLLLDHFDRLSSSVEAKFYAISKGPPPISVAFYRHVPTQGAFTAFTFGLSRVHLPEGALHKELVIRMVDEDVSWALAVGYIAEQLKHKCSFACGDTINFKEAISQHSEMNAFVIIHPNFIDRDSKVVDIQVAKVEIVQLVPIFEAERTWLHQGGATQEFLRMVPSDQQMNPARLPFCGHRVA